MNQRISPPLIVGLLVAVCLAALPVSAQAAFGVRNLTTTARNEDGSVDVQAGSHPFEWNLSFEVAQDSLGKPEGTLQDFFADLPAGMVGNPLAVPRCTGAQFYQQDTPECPPNTQVGVAHVNLVNIEDEIKLPVYNLVPPLGTPARIGFSAVGISGLQQASLRSGDDYGVRVSDPSIPTETAVKSVSETIWGAPGLIAHDARRGLHGAEENGPGVAFVGPVLPFFTLPTSCGGPLATTVEIDSVENPGVFATATALSEQGGAPVGLTGCRSVPFEPTVRLRATSSAADSPTGLEVAIHQPQHELPSGLSSAALKNVTLILPPGVTINPAAANGLSSCSETQVGYLGTEAGALRFTPDPQVCPDAAKVGSVEVNSPLVDHKLAGALYVAKPFENPLSSLLAAYLIVEDEQTGVIVKLAGKVEPDPLTGQLTVTFKENPQLPIEEIDVNLFEGVAAALKTPLTCGTNIANSVLTPWTTPERGDVSSLSSFPTNVAAAGAGTCPGSEATAPNAPSFAAGTVSPQAGSYSNFVLHLARADGTQHLTAIDTTLPEGLTGKLAGIPYCSEASIALARSLEVPNQGAVEQRSPSCPASSEVGTVTVGAGAGSQPYYVTGHAYLAGPYKGAPLSLVVIVPAVAGPFDLGNVVTRVALNVDEFSAQIHAVSDQLPTILDGIPLDLRSIDLSLDRPNFTLNPTSCEPAQILGSATAQTGQVASLRNHFQAAGCSGLAFKPKLQISLKGATKRTGHPALKAVVTYPKQQGAYANIARAQVGLPHSEFLDQSNLNKTCTRPVLLAGSCPKKSIYGKAKAWTPLLEKPLEGPVYLVGGFGYKLPALVAELNGQIKVLLKGKVDTGSNKGIRNTFEAVPDAPVSRFVLEMKGGPKYSLLENSENLCQKPQRAIARLTAQNGAVEQLTPLIANSCMGHGKQESGHGKQDKATEK
jgi:hypothetical protein